MGLVKYQRNQASLERKLQEDNESAQGDNVFALTFKNGTTALRIMPPWSEKGEWYQEITEHFIQSKKRSFTCTADRFGRCPVCEYGDQLTASGNVEAAKGFRPSTKALVNAVVLSEPNGKLSIKDGIKVFKLPQTVRTALLKFDMDTDGDGWNDITDYNHGVNFKIERVGQGLQTKYTVMPMAQRTDIVRRFQEEGIDPNALSLYALDSMFVPASVEQAFEDFNALMSDAPTTEAQPVAAAPVHTHPVAAPVAAPQTNLSAPGFAPAAPPKLSVTIAPPPLPKRG